MAEQKASLPERKEIPDMTRLSFAALVVVCLTVCYCVDKASTPLLTFSEALIKDCTVGVPERPKGPYWHLEWVK